MGKVKSPLLFTRNLAFFLKDQILASVMLTVWLSRGVSAMQKCPLIEYSAWIPHLTGSVQPKANPYKMKRTFLLFRRMCYFHLLMRSVIVLAILFNAHDEMGSRNEEHFVGLIKSGNVTVLLFDDSDVNKSHFLRQSILNQLYISTP